ncbi:MAG TPA: biliverdin-producing heme oxygenase, partial [Opitutaceae bacterium]
MALPSTRPAYLERLKCFYGYIEPWERRVRSILREFPDVLAGREKTVWLREDLAALGVSSGDIDALPRCEELPDLTSAARALGSFYVWEGSTLGGQIISRHLREKLGIE